MLKLTMCVCAYTQAEEEEENMGDVDLWALASSGNALTVNSRWLGHLQDRLLGEDGHPRKVCCVCGVCVCVWLTCLWLCVEECFLGTQKHTSTHMHMHREATKTFGGYEEMCIRHAGALMCVCVSGCL